MTVSLDPLLELCWHPVATLDELEAAGGGPLPVRLLGRDLAVTGTAALDDRCPHRSTRLSVGTPDGDGIRCAYHGWRFAADGQCTEVPAMPEGPIPARACVRSYDVEVSGGLVWVRLDARAEVPMPPHPSWDDPTMKCLMGTPYTWPTSGPRRVENFVDLAHFAWVHLGTLSTGGDVVPEVPEVRRQAGELRFAYTPPAVAVDDEALFGASRYRMPMPLSVDIEFSLPSGARRRLWMTASPVESGSCRTFWSVARDDDLDGDDAAHLAFQELIRDQDERVVCNQVPAEIPLEPGEELSVRTDRISIEYRRWLRELAVAAADDPQRLRHHLSDSVTI